MQPREHRLGQILAAHKEVGDACDHIIYRDLLQERQVHLGDLSGQDGQYLLHGVDIARKFLYQIGQVVDDLRYQHDDQRHDNGKGAHIGDDK